MCRYLMLSGWLSLLLLSACFNSLPQTAMPTGQITVIPASSPTPAVPTLVGNLTDALPVLSGICYTAAADAVDRVFVIRSAEEHIQFYNLADNSGLCDRPVTRPPFDFSAGDVLAGVWHRGFGCTATHTITDYRRDAAARTIDIALRFNVEGDCPYELVRGFWVGIPSAQDYEIIITRVD